MNELNEYRFCPYDGAGLIKNAADSTGRPRCVRCGFVDYQNPRSCVAILILSNGKLLLARRGIEPAKGSWDIPGGFVDAGESAEQAVVREAFEETTLQVRITEYLGSVPDVYGNRNTPTLNLCYLADVVAGKPQPRSDVQALSWVSLAELPTNMAFAHQHSVIAMLKERNRRNE